MKKLIEALHVIQEECKKYKDCSECPMFVRHYQHSQCIFDYVNPEDMDIDEVLL